MPPDRQRAHALATAPRVQGPNHALLAGNVLGALQTLAEALSTHDDARGSIPTSVEVVADDDGIYTARVLVFRPSGTWAVDVTPIDVEQL